MTVVTLVPRLNPSLGFVTAQEIQNTKMKNKNGGETLTRAPSGHE